jgi:hypothetical protein
MVSCYRRHYSCYCHKKHKSFTLCKNMRLLWQQIPTAWDVMLNGLTGTNTKITTAWDVMLNGLTGTNISEEPAALTFKEEENECTRLLWNVGT